MTHKCDGRTDKWTDIMKAHATFHCIVQPKKWCRSTRCVIRFY